MSKGKLIIQASHVSVKTTREANESLVEEWLENGGKKIALYVSTRHKLMKIVNDSDAELPTATVDDLGYTKLEPGTTTAEAIGPGEEDAIDKYTGNLKLVD